MTQTTLLVFARAAGLVARAPGFSHPAVPTIVRPAFALALALAVVPAVTPVHALSLAAFTLALAGDAALGAAIGFGASLLYDGAYFAGRTIDDYLGVRASVPNANVTSAQAFGRLWSYAFLGAFVLLDGWVPLVGAFADSFAHVRPGGFVDAVAWTRYALALPKTVLHVALVVAAPAIAVSAALQIALAAVARVVPRFASFTLTFPVVFAAALVVTVLTVPLLAPLGARPTLVLPWNSPR
jgi:flagellar biosynthesis protein FliR